MFSESFPHLSSDDVFLASPKIYREHIVVVSVAIVDSYVLVLANVTVEFKRIHRCSHIMSTQLALLIDIFLSHAKIEECIYGFDKTFTYFYSLVT